MIILFISFETNETNVVSLKQNEITIGREVWNFFKVENDGEYLAKQTEFSAVTLWSINPS